jgi:hypothetical protein
MFGPPITYWTARFESKHRIAKNFAASAKNVKNITKTLSERQQMRAASIFYNGMFSCDDFILPQQVLMKKNMSSDTNFLKELKNFMSEEDLIVSEITVMSQKYKNADLIVLDMTDPDRMKVGLIQSILVKKKKVYFVCKIYSCIRNWLQYFESINCEDVCSFIESKDICDFKPLIKRGTVEKFNFVLHHRVSFAYK